MLYPCIALNSAAYNPRQTYRHTCIFLFARSNARGSLLKITRVLLRTSLSAITIKLHELFIKNMIEMKHRVP